MSVQREPSGRRSIQFDVEVPGSPEEVWQAIATGPGLSSWFVPATFDEVDGRPVAVQFDYGGGMVFTSAVTACDAPRTIAWEGAGWAPGSPPIATEFTVEARAGGVCVVRVVQSLFASTDDWDGQLLGAEEGWPAIARVLRLYLAHFRGLHSTIAKVLVPVTGTAADAWTILTSALRLSDVTVGQAWAAPSGLPELGGIVEHVSDAPYSVLLRLHAPVPGIAALGTIAFGDMVLAGFTFYFYGDQADVSLARESSRWHEWLQERLAPSGEATPLTA